MTAHEDLFTPIHKGLRSMLSGLSSRMQTHDFADTAASRALVTDLENDFAVARSAGCILCVLARHAVDEEGVIFPAAAEKASPLVRALIEEHHDLTRRELAIAEAAHALVEMGAPADRIAAGIGLNQSVNELVAAYLTHMNREERELVPVMREHFTDAQMAAMRRTIVASQPPDRMFAVLGWMLPSLNVAELSAMLSEMRQGAPPPVLQAILDLCSAKVEPARWSEVKVRTGL